MIIHTVKPGETLWQIGIDYGVPMDEIAKANELPNPNRLVVGQSLVIPTEDSVYTVRPGETLWGIALKFGISAQDLQKANDIENPNLVYPGTVLVIPSKSRYPAYVNGYIYMLGDAAIPIIREVGEYLTYLAPFAYLIREDGSLQPIEDHQAIRTAYSENAIPMMAITNFTSTQLGNNLAHVVLATPEIREQLLQNVIAIMKEKGYQGLNIDFENVLPADRELYNQFLQLAVDLLHEEGFFVSSALAPKESAGQGGLLYEAHDYEAHGRIVDFVILMTYEWGYRLGPPRAISPLDRIKAVLDYAVSVIPRNKIFLGFQIYARDWLIPHVQGQEAETISCQEAIRRAAEYGTVIQYDVLAQSPFFRYTDNQGRMHEVWFEDARSAQAKFDTVKAYRLKGISYWALGYPFPQNWLLLNDNFNITKLL